MVRILQLGRKILVMVISAACTTIVLTGAWTVRRNPRPDTTRTHLPHPLSAGHVPKHSSNALDTTMKTRPLFWPINEWWKEIDESGPFVAAGTQLGVTVFVFATLATKPWKEEKAKDAKYIVMLILEACFCIMAAILNAVFANLSPIQFNGFYLASGLMGVCGILTLLELCVPSLAKPGQTDSNESQRAVTQRSKGRMSRGMPLNCFKPETQKAEKRKDKSPGTRSSSSISFRSNESARVVPYYDPDSDASCSSSADFELSERGPPVDTEKVEEQDDGGVGTRMIG